MENERNLELLEKIKAVKAEISKAVLGKEKIVDTILTTIIAGGHILLEDIPGVGKTTLALAFSKATSLEYQRLQFTPDVLPTDVTGFTVYDKKTDSFIYKPGAALCNLFLADEINRTSSKTQSALLEIMEEGNITVDGVTHEIPQPFTVIATQNPIGYVGTQMLPESQLDRFTVRLSMGYPDANDEINILKGKQGKDPLNSVNAVASGEDIIAMRKAVEEVYTDEMFEGILKLKSVDDCYKFFSDLCTPREIKSMSQRFTVAKMLIEKVQKNEFKTISFSYDGPKEYINDIKIIHKRNN